MCQFKFTDGTGTKLTTNQITSSPRGIGFAKFSYLREALGNKTLVRDQVGEVST